MFFQCTLLKQKKKQKVAKKLGLITKTLKLSKSLKSNKEISYRILAQIASVFLKE